MLEVNVTARSGKWAETHICVIEPPADVTPGRRLHQRQPSSRRIFAATASRVRQRGAKVGETMVMLPHLIQPMGVAFTNRLAYSVV